MKKSVLAILLVASYGLTGCATILGGGTGQSVSMASTPAAATFTVKSASGLQMAQGTTPTQARLPRKNEYQVEIVAPGFKPQTVALAKGVNGWFWANLLLGGVVGMAIDAVSGAMYKLEPSVVSVSLVQGIGDDANETFSLVQFLDDKGKVIAEKRSKLIPAE